MNKKERLSEFNRKNILDSAKQLFLEKGINQTTMDEIAKKADYSKSTIYVYFKSKDEIYNYIILEYMELLRDGLSEALADVKGFNEGFYAICETMVDFYNTYPLYFESILGEVKFSKDKSDTVLSQTYEVGEQINKVIETYMQTYIFQKQIKSDLPPILQTSFAIWAGICGIISLANKKEVYINEAMNISKEEFMKDGFKLLLRSISPEKG